MTLRTPPRPCNRQRSFADVCEIRGAQMGAEEERLKLSTLFRRTVDALFHPPVSAVIIAAATIYLPILVASRFFPAPEDVFSWRFVFWTFCTAPIYSAAVIFQAWISFQAMEGDAAKDALKSTLSRLPTLYAASLIIFVVWFVGVLALFIPGVVWGVVCIVAIPAAAIERVGVARAIERSFELTRGRRLALFGYSIAMLSPILLAQTLIDFALLGELPASSPAREITQAFVGVLSGAFSAAAYRELVRLQARDRGEAQA